MFESRYNWRSEPSRDAQLLCWFSHVSYGQVAQIMPVKKFAEIVFIYALIVPVF